jgi:hypothetical protein
LVPLPVYVPLSNSIFVAGQVFKFDARNKIENRRESESEGETVRE